MKIGILAYQSAINFGANLQIASTFGYLKNNGHDPRVINYIPEDLRQFYASSKSEQADAHVGFINKYCTLTEECHNDEELASVIIKEGIDSVIIGSDAVAQHHPLLERIDFPTRNIINIRKLTSDRMFPNPFWGTFSDYLPQSFPMAILSASNQDSSFKLMGNKTRKQMLSRLNKMRFISARDTWTQAMYNYVFQGEKQIQVTPDPVFAFNQNVLNQPSEAEIREKFGLKRDYFLLSFLDSKTVSLRWLTEFEQKAEDQGIICVALPFPAGIKFKNALKHKINLPLSPMEWYCLIKYSKGYIGHNMHPIVVSLHNANPFFSFDNYGRRVRKHFVDESTSKIRHILTKADLLGYRSPCCNGNQVPPTPDYVLDRLLGFKKEIVETFSQQQTEAYNDTMNSILQSLQKNITR